MSHKLAFTIIAAASLSFAGFAPASAGHGGRQGGGMHMGGHGGDHGMHFRHANFWGRSAFFVGSNCYKTVWTNSGPRRVYVCGAAF